MEEHMNKKLPLHTKTHLTNALKQLYISPLERCNLACKICYTAKPTHILTEESLRDFVLRYKKVQELESVLLCGGEVTLLTYMPSFINWLTEQGLYVQIITNGTNLAFLDALTKPSLVNVIVSIDGRQPDHDANRGEGQFAQTIAFLQKAREKGCALDVFTVVSQRNLRDLSAFEKELRELFGLSVHVTYHPRKSRAYLQNHPVSNRVGEVDGFGFLSQKEMNTLAQEHDVFPPPILGCYQFALMSDGMVYACCEGIRPIGKMTDDITVMREKLEQRLHDWFAGAVTAPEKQDTLGCVEPQFLCGMSLSYLHMRKK